MEIHDFGWALARLRQGQAVSRAGWNGPGQYVKLQEPDPSSANTLPYLWIRTSAGNRVPWLASQTDMLGEDWQLGESRGRGHSTIEAQVNEEYTERRRRAEAVAKAHLGLGASVPDSQANLDALDFELPSPSERAASHQEKVAELAKEHGIGPEDLRRLEEIGRFSAFPDDLSCRFTYHPPKPGQSKVYEKIRSQAHGYAIFLTTVVPESRELNLAIRALEEAVFWANAGVARRST